MGLREVEVATNRGMERELLMLAVITWVVVARMVLLVVAVAAVAAVVVVTAVIWRLGTRRIATPQFQTEIEAAAAPVAIVRQAAVAVVAASQPQRPNRHLRQRSGGRVVAAAVATATLSLSRLTTGDLNCMFFFGTAFEYLVNTTATLPLTYSKYSRAEEEEFIRSLKAPKGECSIIMRTSVFL